jgi:hypothetical protein
MSLNTQVTVNVGTPGTIGYKPGHTGKIIGYVIELDKPTHVEEVLTANGKFDIGGHKYVFTADRTLYSHDLKMATLVKK